MKKILSIISLAFALSISANAQFLNTTEIINSDCRIQFLNSNGIKIYELIGENLTWWKQSSGAIIIRDKVTQVTISATYSGTPSLSALDDSLDAWILACKDCCSGGGGGGTSDTIVLDGNAFIVQGQNSAIQVDNTVLFEGDTIRFTGISTTENDLDILIGVASGILPESTALAQVSNDSGSVSIYSAVDSGFPLMAIDVISGAIDYSVIYAKTGVQINGANLPQYPLAIGNVGDELVRFGNAGNIEQEGSYANRAYYVDDTPGGFTIPDNKYLAIYDPASLQASATITMPANPVDGQIQIIAFGGTITSGTAVTSLTLATTGGQTLNVGTAASTGLIEQPLTFLYIGYLNKWYLISN